MRLRFWLYLVFGTIAILPLALIGAWTQNYVSSSELDRAGKQQQLLAELSSYAGSAYLAKLKSDFEASMVTMSLRGVDEASDFSANSGFEETVIVEFGAASGTSMPEAARKTAEILRAYALPDEVVISPVIEAADGRKSAFVVYLEGNRMAFARLDGRNLVRKVANSDANNRFLLAIIDMEGNSVAASGPSAPRMFMYQQPSVVAATNMRGASNITTLKLQGIAGEMLAGIVTIPGTGLSILSAEPVTDINARIASANRKISMVTYLSLALVLMASIMGSHILANPIERLIGALRKTGTDQTFNEIEVEGGLMTPIEHRQVGETYNRMVRELRELHFQMVHMAFVDQTTMLPNREAFRKSIEYQLSRLAQLGQGAAIAFIDVDNFKEINDTHGHHTGDQVLRYLASRMTGIIETMTGHAPILDHNQKAAGFHPELPKPLLARFGGDEFVLFIPENAGLIYLEDMLSQILSAISCPISGIDVYTKLSGSVGVVRFPEQGLSYVELVKRADIAMYHAKKRGKGCVEYYNEGIGDKSSAEIRRDIKLAMQNNELELYYQPKVHAQTLEITGVEALVRWIHPVKGVLGPAHFIPAVEDSDEATKEFGEWVLRRACQDLRILRNNNIDITVAVNISARHFVSEEFPDNLIEICREENCSPDNFEIEITEETALNHEEGTGSIIGQLQDVGFRVSLDDYGRGYSNLTRLAELNVDTIKIDGPLTARLTRDERTKVIFEATINMANGLGSKTVAEGVETAAEVGILTGIGCTELQGFYFSTPLPISELIAWIDERNTSQVATMQTDLARRIA